MTLKTARWVLNNVDTDQMLHIFSLQWGKVLQVSSIFTLCMLCKISADDILVFIFIGNKILHLMQIVSLGRR